MLHKIKKACGSVLMMLLSTQSSYGVTHPSIKMELTITSIFPAKIHGKVEILDPSLTGCLKLPLNSPESELIVPSESHYLASLNRVRKDDISFSGYTEVSGHKDFPSTIDIKNQTNKNRNIIKFYSIFNQKGMSPNERLFHFFHPIFLRDCTSEKAIPIKIKASIKLAADTSADGKTWTIVGNNMGNVFHFHDSATFMLVKNKNQMTLQVGNTPIRILFNSDVFKKLIPTIKESFSHAQRYAGDYPFQSLSIIETENEISIPMEGVIALNMPKQAVFSSLQFDLLNWSHWSYIDLLAKQWYGTAIKPLQKQQEWFVKGLREFIAYTTLKRIPQRYSLFNSFETGYIPFSLDYVGAQNLTAALLSRRTRDKAVTDNTYQTLSFSQEMSSLNFIKQAVSLRYLNSIAGSLRFSRFLRRFTQSNLHRTITPADFINFFELTPSPFSPALRRDLRSYQEKLWTAPGWPDYTITTVNKRKLKLDGWVAEVTAQDKNGFNLPIPVRVTDSTNNSYETTLVNRTTTTNGYLTGEIITKYEPEKVEIDPNRTIFDSNRFNNRNQWPVVRFLPGSANSIEDDNYTAIWLPFPFRRPGEKLSLGLRSAIFRYVQSSVLLGLEKEIGSDRLAYSIESESFSTKNNYSVAVAFEKSYKDDRNMQVLLARGMKLLPTTSVTSGIFSRNRAIVGIGESNHTTLGGQLTVTKAQTPSLPCDLNLFSEYEKAPAEWSNGFSYERRFLITEASCWQKGLVSPKIRGFYGELSSQGEVPKNILFDPDKLEEAKLRLDMSNVPLSRQLASASIDLFIKTQLSFIPQDSLVLTKRTKFRAFHNFGFNPNTKTEFESSGIGLLFPLGGDLTTAGSLELTQISLISIVYSRIGNLVNDDPRVLLDFSGSF